jgi:hypothetical protein
MRIVVLIGLLASGCTLWQTREPPIEAGTPDVFIGIGTWFQGEPNELGLDYPNAELCDEEDWSCVNNPAATMTVLSATCHGCTFVDDPTGKSALKGVSATAIATADGPITIEATLQFDATQQVAHVTGSVTGDHEVSLAATCALIDRAALGPHNELTASQPRDCDPAGTRSATDAVLVFPTVQFAHGQPLPRFCVELDTSCGGEPTVTATPAATAWGQVTDSLFAPFLVMPPLDATTTAITLSLPLLTGEVSTISLSIPPLAATLAP